MAASLSVSVVTYAPDLAVVRQTIDALRESTDAALAGGTLERVQLWLVDNGPGDAWVAPLTAIADQLSRGGVETTVITGHGNVGYGEGHNLAIRHSHAKYHLVLNPDVVLDVDGIALAVEFLDLHPEIGMLAPQARDGNGRMLYLCKRYPTVFDLALRGFAPEFLRRLFRRRLERYEMRDVLDDNVHVRIPIVSGSFMFCRREALAAVGSFSSDFFLYFEDFDLSLRVGWLYDIAYVPSVKIVHFGGYTSRKGSRHIRLFARSAITFFHIHGWKLW